MRKFLLVLSSLLLIGTQTKADSIDIPSVYVPFISNSVVFRQFQYVTNTNGVLTGLKVKSIDNRGYVTYERTEIPGSLRSGWLIIADKNTNHIWSGSVQVVVGGYGEWTVVGTQQNSYPILFKDYRFVLTVSSSGGSMAKAGVVLDINATPGKEPFYGIVY